jgi:hypothetical protein
VRRSGLTCLGEAEPVAGGMLELLAWGMRIRRTRTTQDRRGRNPVSRQAPLQRSNDFTTSFPAKWQTELRAAQCQSLQKASAPRGGKADWTNRLGGRRASRNSCTTGGLQSRLREHPRPNRLRGLLFRSSGIGNSDALFEACLHACRYLLCGQKLGRMACFAGVRPLCFGLKVRIQAAQRRCIPLPLSLTTGWADRPYRTCRP